MAALLSQFCLLSVVLAAATAFLFGGGPKEKEVAAPFTNDGRTCYWGPIGCYKDENAQMLSVPANIPEKDLTFEVCAKQCSSNGFALMGLRDRKCLCGNAFGIAPQPSDDCDQKCGGNFFSKHLNPFNAKKCGGRKSISMHACGGLHSNGEANGQTQGGK